MRLVYIAKSQFFEITAKINEIPSIEAMHSKLSACYGLSAKQWTSDISVTVNDEVFFTVYITNYLRKGELSSIKEGIRRKYMEFKAECTLPKLSDRQALAKCREYVCINSYQHSLINLIKFEKSNHKKEDVKTIVNLYKWLLKIGGLSKEEHDCIRGYLCEIKEFLPAEFLQELGFVPARKVSHPRKKAIARAKALLRNYYSMVA